MKKMMILLFTLLVFSLSGQSTSLSTFEEMWIVSPEFLNLDLEPMVPLNLKSMSKKSLSAIKSFKDLNKIIADTPFLSLTLTPAPQKSGLKGKDGKSPTINLGDRYEPGGELNGWTDWMVLFKKGDEYVIGMPTKQPKKLKKELLQKDMMIFDKKGKLSSMLIKEIRIENGTY